MTLPHSLRIILLWSLHHTCFLPTSFCPVYDCVFSPKPSPNIHLLSRHLNSLHYISSSLIYIVIPSLHAVILYYFSAIFLSLYNLVIPLPVSSIDIGEYICPDNSIKNPYLCMGNNFSIVIGEIFFAKHNVLDFIHKIIIRFQHIIYSIYTKKSRSLEMYKYVLRESGKKKKKLWKIKINLYGWTTCTSTII